MLTLKPNPMKKFVLILFVLAFCLKAVAQVSISVDNSTPDPSAMLDVKSPIKGLLPPRVALSATNLAVPVSSPAIGLQVYNTATAGTAPYIVNPGIYSWDGIQWVPANAPKGVNTGDMQYWNGTQWVLIPAGAYGQQLFFCNGIPVWGGCPPVLTTAAISSITANSAVSGGNITLDGGSPVIARGVCWSTSLNPTIADNKTTDGNGIGSFVSNITGLSPNTHYYIRSYATNSAMTGYGNELDFTTLCEFYPTVGVSIEASTNPVCDGSIVSLQAASTNGGLLPVYQWKINGVSVGTNNSVYMYTPTNNDAVQCILTSSLPCTSTPALSNTIIITVNPMLSVGVTIAASVNNVCAGNTVTFTATGTNTGTISSYQWKLGGNVISGATNMTYSYVPTNNDVVTCVLTSNTPCTLGNTATSNVITMIVNAAPESPTLGTHEPSQTQIVWNWNTVSGATGYKWNTTNNYTTATDMGTGLSKTETGLTCGTAYSRYVWAYNVCGYSQVTILTFATTPCGSFTCGQNVAINHVAGAVAPVNKTTTYNTVTNIPGETSKCWITSNLGSDHQASTVNDATEASAGWYWQFNRKQGYKHDGTTRTPNTTWISSISETSDWITANDPCAIELGPGWRIPTNTEWYDVDASGNWTNWNGPYNSGLKIHAAGDLNRNNGSLESRGSRGNYWNSAQIDGTLAWNLGFGSGDSDVNGNAKAFSFSIRCLRECSTAPNSPTSGTHTPSQTAIIWNWNSVNGSTGYKWNTTNDYSTATDMNTATTKTETGLTCNTAFTRYVWAYNTCGNSEGTPLTQTTTACPVPCGQNITINHIAGAVAPVAKTTTYGTVTNIPGETSKCWITSNLGSDHQATAVDDATEASAGWYWQFNRKQGYKHDGTIRTPNTIWISSISETSDWITANDPCNIELGTTWRIPTYTEWYNVDNTGGWTTWTGPWSSGLKMHAAGSLLYINGSLVSPGGVGHYWSSTQDVATRGWHLYFTSSYSYMGNYDKALGFSTRCIRD